jgi:hypothetical protein
MGDEHDNPASSLDPSYVLAARDYAEIAHLENPSVIERILSPLMDGRLTDLGIKFYDNIEKYQVETSANDAAA